ncbi:MAG: tetratricopeptide repeat protein [Desulfobacterales bacterium]|nr:tetratricopeptide repeat protein [Desulfobacterales bacterium]
MNPRSLHLQGVANTLRAVIAALVLATTLAGCTSSTPMFAANQESPSPLAPQTSPTLDAESWPLYQLYLQAQRAIHKDDLSSAKYYLTLASQKDPESSLVKREVAVVHLLDNDVETAEKTLNTTLKVNPNDVESLLILVRIRLGQRRINDAETLLKRVISAAPNREDPYFRLGLIQTSTGKHKEALETYQAMLRVFPYSFAGHYYVGLLLMDKGQRDNAKKHFRESIAIAPEFTGARMELAATLMNEGKTAEATRHYKKILTEDPTSIRAALAVALTHLNTGTPQKAQHYIKTITQRTSAWHSVYALINRHYISNQRFSDAKRLLEAMEGSYGKLSEYNYMLGYVCEKMGLPNETTHYFKRISPNSEYYERAILFVSIWQWESGMQEEAAVTLEDALDQHPESIDILTYLASFHEELSNFAKAENYLLKGIELNETDASLHFRIGVLYDKWGKSEASTRSVKRALALDPEDANALNFLGYTYARQGINLEDAERMIKKALAKKPGDGYITDSLGWVYFQKGLFAKALVILRKAASILPDDPVILEHLGDALVKNNLTQEALDSYKRSIEQGHENIPAIEEKIRRIEQSLSSRH